MRQSMNQLQQLTLLDISDNWCDQLPRVVGQLSALKHLYLSGNDTLHALPSNMTQLQQLEVFVADHCDLGTLPDNISNWQNLHLLV